MGKGVTQASRWHGQRRRLTESCSHYSIQPKGESLSESSALSPVVIGLEVHIQLATASKAFCGCDNRYGAPPNTLTCPICLGYPGALPMFNRQALVLASRLALALKCRLQPHSVFSRKNYYYPDLPKGFQISQYDLPLATNGTLEFMDEGQTLHCGIERVHLEEDVAKAMHGSDAAGNECTKLDYNRSGVPLVEVVGKPELTGSRAAKRYLEEMQRLIRSTGASECDMEKGSLRVDVNVSLRNADGSFGTKIEVKNLNSFRSVEKALEYEIERQGELLGRGESFQKETRLWDEKSATTILMRVKEGADDYRYFPEPDLPAISTDEEFKQSVWDGMMAEWWLGYAELPLERERWCLAAGNPTRRCADICRRCGVISPAKAGMGEAPQHRCEHAVDSVYPTALCWRYGTQHRTPPASG